jgi:hypothetical protein
MLALHVTDVVNANVPNKVLSPKGVAESSDDIVAFQQKNLLMRSGKQGGGPEAAYAGTNDDDVIGFSLESCLAVWFS